MFHYQIRMCFQDVDGEGIVYHSNYLNYAERARTEWMAQMGLQNKEVMDMGVAMVLRHLEMDFIRSARLDDILDIDVRVVESKNASTIIEQTISVKQRQRECCLKDWRVGKCSIYKGLQITI